MHLVPAVDCEWNDWQVGECSVTCAGGSRTNSRTKNIEESDGTDEVGTCDGDATMVEDCNTQDCPRKYYYRKYNYEQYFQENYITHCFVMTTLIMIISTYI